MTFLPLARKAGAAALAGLLLTAAPTALFAETPADTLVVASAIDDIVSLDPAEAYEFSGLDMVNNVYDGLVEINPVTLELEPGLAESWSVADDGVTYTFKMKSGVTFASGNPVTADSAAWSLQRAVKLNKTPAFILNQFGWTAENVDSMITASGDVLTIKVDKPFAPTFLYNCLTAGVASIVDAETVKTHDVAGDMGNEWLKSNSAGTGAYVLASFKPNEGMVLTARPGYWRGDAKIANVFIQHIPEAATERLQLEKGDIDVARSLTPTDVEGMAGNADVKIQSDVGGQVYYMAFNQKNENYKNAKFLDAMRWAIDYQGMADTIMKGAVIPHQAFLPKGYLGALDDLPYSLDLEKAKALLAESGIENPTIKLSVRNSADRIDVATSIQNTFGQAGIKVELDVGEGADQLKAYRARTHDATLQTWGPDYPDPNTNSSTFAENPDNSDEANNTGYLAWRNAYDPGEMTAMSQAAVMERDPAKRVEMYAEIQKKHRETSPFILMFQQARQTGLRAGVEGFYTGGAVDAAAYWLATK
ncbi:ABC transporter substrate-binding protein [Stagnihabitans tardus]|uniref:ABC transporter substrate-binding protein n=1 Tax=Stagnihabitans tardus TaxID=2699202 RepID=A0AAE4YAG3_9RHOB|nr:ABC transporter substrate-binding protein [Stagnihabitans tardus]NBZ88299.1 ABC transporter substrate-binding protein [Stagnihabitans tardus]